VERCTNDHNYSAIIRTAEALGVQHLWLVEPQQQEPAGRGQVWQADAEQKAEHAAFAQKAAAWTTIREFSTTAACLAALREDGRTLWVTDLSQQAARLVLGGDGDGGEAVPERLAIAFGTESVGCTVRAVPGRLSAISVFLCKSVFYGVFVWARRALSGPKWRFPARAGGAPAGG
jgi:tRNA G18 (ribose-2'-O)-methylase SpoU